MLKVQVDFICMCSNNLEMLYIVAINAGLLSTLSS